MTDAVQMTVSALLRRQSNVIILHLTIVYNEFHGRILEFLIKSSEGARVFQVEMEQERLTV